jgi:KipI family sensor histidine kinase inhibitor
MTQRLGDIAVRIPRPRGKSGAAIADAVRAWPGVVDVALTESWIGVVFANAPVVAPENIAALDALVAAETNDTTVEIDVRYDGPDLADVATLAGVDVDEIVARHSCAEYTVLFLGFRPGFAYLGGLSSQLHVPRLAEPRARVPKNAVAIAGPYAGVYPFESPGGWRILGTARGVTLFDSSRGALLRPGDRVRFHPA